MSKTQTTVSFIAPVIALLFSTVVVAQTKLSGQVTDEKGEGIPGANVYLQDTYDGATTDLEGHFAFNTAEQGNQTLIISFIGYHTVEALVLLEGESQEISFELKEVINKLDGVVITAGAFEASDEKKSVVLKPLDIAMTAGATADIPGALNTLPGTQTNGETGRLFVRGGTGEETKVFIDGMLVQEFYNPSAPNTPGRSRFSPFLFKGTMFTTGGYSAEYGQALSSTLSLKSIDLPEETESNISLMTVGLDASHSHRWDSSSLFTQVGYTNLNPYIGLVDQAYDFEKGYTSLDGIVSFRQKMKKGGMIKVYGNFNTAGFVVNQFNINDPDQPNHTDLTNDYYFLNATYHDIINDKWSHRTGVSFTSNRQEILFNEDLIDDRLMGGHVKSVFENDHSERMTLRMGTELFHNQIGREVGTFDGDFTDNLWATFAEADVYLSNKLVLRPGLRSEYTSYLQEWSVSPRASLAYKTSEYAQVSAAYGQYRQSPIRDYMLVTDNLVPEKATHYILNYQIIKDDRVFRIEGYYKDYTNLVRTDSTEPFNPQFYNQQGSGYAQGFDLFWRDNKSIKNVDYWISYSFLDTKRQFQDFPVEAVPTFASSHNFSAVYKHFIVPIRTQFGMSYSFTSGRPYHDPNREGFNQGRIPSYHDLSFNAAYLFRQNIIFYTSVTNLTGRDNIFGYDYANQPNAEGRFDRIAIGQPAKRFYFLGVFITLSKNKEKNQLNNL